jgi:quinol monooxygenase YgiN
MKLYTYYRSQASFRVRIALNLKGIAREDSFLHLEKGDQFAEDAGCEQFEVFKSVFDPDTLVLLELWKDQAALDAHAKLQAQRPALPEGLRLGAGEREDYTYNRTR